MVKLVVRANDTGSTLEDVARSELLEETNQEYVIPAEGYRRWDDFAVSIPVTPAADDLGLVTGTLGTHFPSLQTGDLKTAGATSMYAGFTFFLPPEYVAGGLITVRASAGMLTTVADTTATLDFEVYSNDGDSTSSADLQGTAATDINNLTFGNKDFVVSPTGRIPGDQLQIRAHVAVNDGAESTAVIGCIGKLSILLSIKG